MRKDALIIHPGRISDLGDLLHVARAEGKQALRTDNVQIVPADVFRDSDGDFVVVVKTYSAPAVGDKRTRE